MGLAVVEIAIVDFVLGKEKIRGKVLLLGGEEVEHDEGREWEGAE